jgi:hypothetical protein
LLPKQQNCTNLKLFFPYFTPIVAASDPKALEILEANPNPVEAPITNFLSAIYSLLILHIQFDFLYFVRIHLGGLSNKSSHSWFYNHFISFNR